MGVIATAQTLRDGAPLSTVANTTPIAGILTAITAAELTDRAVTTNRSHSSLRPGMLAIARRRAEELGRQVELRVGDAEALEIPSTSR